MPIQTMVKNEMYLVGNLQDYGRPYSSLFLDKEGGCLYLLVRVAGMHLMTAVSSEEISDYMNRRRSLGSIFKGKDSSAVTFNGRQMVLSHQPPGFDISTVIKEEDVFDPDFCHDKLKLKTFLKRFNAGVYSTSERIAI